MGRTAPRPVRSVRIRRDRNGPGHPGTRTRSDPGRTRHDTEFELVDLAEYNRRTLDEFLPPSAGQYAHDHTKAWAGKIAEFDGYLFVTPEHDGADHRSGHRVSSRPIRQRRCRRRG
jgi:hypothetical protein